MPMGHWFYVLLYRGFIGSPFSPRFIQLSIFHQVVVEEVVSTLTRGCRQYVYCLWILLMVKRWYRVFIG